MPVKNEDGIEVRREFAHARNKSSMVDILTIGEQQFKVPINAVTLEQFRTLHPKPLRPQALRKTKSYDEILAVIRNIREGEQAAIAQAIGIVSFRKRPLPINSHD